MSEKKPIVPYTKYAFANPYNLALLGGMTSAALLTGNWWLAVVAGGFEAIWMLFAPDSRLLRKLWFDKRFADEEETKKRQELERKFRTLGRDDALRCTALMAKHAQIDRLATENPAFTGDLLQGELGKLEKLVDSFIELSVTSARYRDYLELVDIGAIESDQRRYEKQIERAREPEQKALAQKNLAIVLQRREKFAEIRRYMQRAVGELELIENAFRLLADQIVTMQSPQELGGQLDELLDGVQAIKETARETDALMATQA